MVTVDPGQQGPHAELEDGTIAINPNVGAYDVAVTTGASYSTQKSEANAAFTSMMQANPAMTPAIAPLWAQTLDIPNGDKVTQVFTAMAPPAIQAILNPQGKEGAGNSAAELAAKNDQLSKALQEAIQHAKDAQNDADQAHAECERLKAQNDDKDDALVIDAYNAETNRIKVLGTALDPAGVQALVAQTINNMLAHPDPLPGEMGQEPEMYAQQGVPQQPEQELPGDPMTPDGSQQHESAEAPQFEQAEAQSPGEGAMQ
jgi:hypothetical protein